MYVPTVTAVFTHIIIVTMLQICGQKCSVYRLRTARAAFLWLKLLQKRNLSFLPLCPQFEVTNCQIWVSFFPHLNIGYSVYDEREFGSGILPKVVVLNKNVFCHYINCFSLQCNQFLLHSNIYYDYPKCIFSVTCLALDSQWLNSNKYFVNGLFKK
jgi:hypothetical protein